MTSSLTHLPARTPDGVELAGLLSSLRDQHHPGIAGYATHREGLEFLLDRCTIAVFDRFDESDDGTSTVLLMVMDQGPEFVTGARLESGGHAWKLSHTTLGDFVPYAAPSRHLNHAISESKPPSREPRAPDAADLNNFLKMFRAASDQFLMEGFKNDAARLDYLGSQARIAIFDRCRSGSYDGPLAFFLWPAGLRYLTVAIRTDGRWCFAGGEVDDV